MSKPVTKLKQIRESKFMSMTEVAEKAKLSVQTISFAELGNKISLGSIRKIAAALKVAPERLL